MDADPLDAVAASRPAAAPQATTTTSTATTATTGTSEARLRLWQLLSPALPVGAFSYSEGLELLVQSGRITDSASLGRWLEAELERGLLTLEAASLAGLQQDLARARSDRGAMATVRERDGWLLAQREAAEMRAQQRQMGGSLCQLLEDLGWPLPDRPGGAPALAWTGAWAWAGVCLDLEAPALVEAYLHSWTANQISAALRLVPLGPTDAQRLLLSLVPCLARRAQALSTADPELLWCGGVGAGLAQLAHAELYSRLFRS